jgi:2-phosphosulfolactate phosphatase
MDIVIDEFTQGAKKAEGLTVIIDVFRAFSVACYAFDRGVRRIIDVSEPEKAFDLRKKLFRETILVGERNEIKIDGFDAGNSPTEILLADIKDKTMIHTTTAGTNGILNALNATEILGAGLVNARAVANYIRHSSPDKVTLVAMGYRADTTADEDILCARYIKDLINGKNPDIRDEVLELMNGSGARFFNPANILHSPPTDFFLCTDVNRFNFILRAERNPSGFAELFCIEMD